ncbi:MAG: RNA 3'-terminal phosphate cyclase [Chloroflexota bacterium]|nr:RNA 3'-terminal phosphate cyclase [Chloroflexota bacterium]
MIIIDGSYGEGGGQILRTALTLSALTGKPVRIENIRAGRRKPGLAAQHLTGVLAVAEICSAELEGAKLGSQALSFVPQSPPKAGKYTFDVAEARRGGSAGSVGLVFQTLLLPLAFAAGESHLVIKGGTHVAWSPPFHYLKHVYLPTLARMGIEAKVEIEKWGWYPIGGGGIRAQVSGLGSQRDLNPLELNERGKLVRLWGISATSNLPAHIGQRQKRGAEGLLRQRGFDPQIEVVDAPSPGQGTCVFIVAEYENAVAGFSSLGEIGKPAERVAEEACREFIEYHQSGACLDKHLADQLILPMALAGSPSAFTTSEITQHLLTNIWVVEQFIGAKFEVKSEERKVMVA